MPTLTTPQETRIIRLEKPPVKTLDKNKVGIILGGFLGLWHAGWGLLVAVGAAQPVLDFVMWLHFLNNPFYVEAFSVTKTLSLVVFTSAMGFALGWLFALLWNVVQER